MTNISNSLQLLSQCRTLTIKVLLATGPLRVQTTATKDNRLMGSSQHMDSSRPTDKATSRVS